ncbi:MAG: alpha-amylase/4-alpha-glucanotransferase domain-containing protein, partial [Myxococcota bacterium]
ASGPLLDWAASHHPQFLEELRTLVGRGQVEVLGGGYQEPMLAILPDRDAVGQLTRMAERCEHWLGERPRGMWLAERVWEPDLARVIAMAGYRYTLLDDTHLRAAGVEGDLGPYYVTEKAGHTVAVFPIDYGLRTRIPFAEVDDLIGYLRTQRGRAAVYGDDAEKFGLWPTTERRVWTNRWLERFALALEENSAWIECATPSDIMAQSPASGSVYIPTISYREMSSWSLPPEASLQFNEVGRRLAYAGYEEQANTFLRGGIWQGFLSKYPESNLIYRKMLRTSERVREATGRRGPTADKAIDALYRGQCNCAYWHGLFGGLYLQHLRSALVSSLIEADVLAAPRTGVRIESVDFDGDLSDEVAIETPAYELFLSPRRGGSGLMLNLVESRFHLTGVLARRREAYHVDVPRARVVAEDDLENVSAHDLVRATEDGLEAYLRVDPYPRGAFVDHLLAEETTPDDFDHGRGQLIGLGDTVYQPAIYDKGVSLRAPAGLPGTPTAAIEKAFAFTERTITADYEVRVDAPARFATHLDFTLLSPDEVGGRRLSVFSEGKRVGSLRPGDREVHPQVDRIQIEADSMGVAVELRISPPCELWRLPIETVSQSERGFERAYQGTALVMSWAVHDRHNINVAVEVPAGR